MINRLSDQQIEEVLKNNIIGRISCNDGEKTYIVPVNYMYDNKYIILHAKLGLKIQMMRKNPAVCFEVEEITTNTDWRTVVLWGKYEELLGKERDEAMKKFSDKMLPLKISQTGAPLGAFIENIHGKSFKKENFILYRIVIEVKTGRFETPDTI